MLSRVGLPCASRYMSCEALPGARFAKIDEGGAAVGEAHQHESAAAQISRVRIGDRHGEADGNRRVHRVAAVLKNFHADIGGERISGDHHRVLSVLRLARGQPAARPRAAGSEEEQIYHSPRHDRF